MSKTSSISITISVSPAMLSRILSGEGMFKTVTVEAIAGKPLAAAVSAAVHNEPAPRTYGLEVCDSKTREKLSAALDAFRGPGMLKRVQDYLGMPFSAVNALVTAESAARRNNSGIMADEKSLPNTKAGVQALLAKLGK